jgi:hypothetical protein
MECMKIQNYDENHNPVYRPKLKFDTLDQAIEQAKIFNSKQHQIHKLIAYKCPICFKFHIGRGKKEITEKERNKYKTHLKDKKKW